MTKSARTLAIDSIAKAERTQDELRQILGSHSLSQEEIEVTVAWACGLGLVSDERVAERVLEIDRADRGHGLERLRAKMTRRGLSDEIQSEVLAMIDPTEELGKARQFIASRQWKSLAQTLRALSARGFSEETILLIQEEATTLDVDY